MTTTIYDVFIGLGLDVTKYKEGLEKVVVDGKAGSQAVKFSFTELRSAIDLVSGALQTVGAIAQTAFEWGKEGAEVAQTAASFDLLLEKTGAMPDLLEQLRAASQGTVDDVTLMSSSLTLAAGAEAGFAAELLNATPQLLEMAKAANKLNPTLGDTQFLYESIATGIKRGSPMILDNLGITVRLEDANARYAESLGKTVEELTSTEQKQALLNEVLDKGSILMDQVGGDTSSAVDDFARFETATKNATDQLKEEFMPVVADVAEGLANLLTGYDKLVGGIQGEIDAIAKEKKSWDEYISATTAVLESHGLMVKEQDGFIQVFRREGQVMREVTDEYNLRNRAAMDTAAITEGLIDTHERLRNSEAEAAAAALEQAAAEEANAAAAKKAAEAVAKMVSALKSMALEGGISAGIINSLDAYETKVTEASAQNAELTEEIKRLVREGADPASEEIRKLTEKYSDNIAKMDDLREATNRATKELIYQKISAHMTEDAALYMARQLGILNEQEFMLWRKITDATKAADENGSALLELNEVTGQYGERIKELAGQFEALDPGMTEFNENLKKETLLAEKAAAETQRLADVQAALEAGLSGRLQVATDNYRLTLEQTSIEHEKLIEEYWALTGAQDATKEQLDEVSRRLDENNQKQIEAAEALRKTTAEMIYQIASQGLSSDAALVLARGMGLVSEEDYNLIVQLQQLRAEFVDTKTGMIEGADAAALYTQKVLELYNSVLQLNSAMAASPLSSATPGNGYVGGGIYTGGPGENIGPGATSSTVNNWNFNATYPPGSGMTAAKDMELMRLLMGGA